jgi:hypothetical protein
MVWRAKLYFSHSFLFLFSCHFSNIISPSLSSLLTLNSLFLSLAGTNLSPSSIRSQTDLFLAGDNFGNKYVFGGGFLILEDSDVWVSSCMDFDVWVYA